LLADCLQSVQADLTRGDITGQIWVVDNASADGSAEMVGRDFPDAQLIASPQNLGFAGGNNAALRAIGFGQEKPTADLPAAVLLLNPDTIVHPGALPILSDFLRRHPRAGIAGARLVYGDGSFQHSVFGFPGLWQLAIELLPLPGRLAESSLNGRYPPSLYEAGQPFRVGHPLGAAMAVRGEAIQQVGLLDEQYQMYVEEVDWAKRIVQAGWHSYCVPEAVVTHLGGQSTGQIKTTSFINLWRSRHQFYRKHYSPPKVWLAGLIVRWGMRRQAKLDRQERQTDPALAERLDGYRTVSKIWTENQL